MAAKGKKDQQGKAAKGGIPDPFAAFREFLDAGERKLNQVLADQSASDDAKASRARSTNAALDMQNAVQNLWGRYFEGINVASRSDVLRMGDRLSRIEEGIARLETRLGALEGEPDSAEDRTPRRKKAEPKRTRRPPTESTQAAKEAKP